MLEFAWLTPFPPPFPLTSQPRVCSIRRCQWCGVAALPIKHSSFAPTSRYSSFPSLYVISFKALARFSTFPGLSKGEHISAQYAPPRRPSSKSVTYERVYLLQRRVSINTLHGPRLEQQFSLLSSPPTPSACYSSVGSGRLAHATLSS